MRILTIVGARPQFIKAAMISRAIDGFNRQSKQCQIVEEIIHTGQHYDDNMSDIFFNQMQIPEPAVNLNVGSGLHGEMTARILSGVEKKIIDRKPDWILVYGDTNSTLAGALAAAKLHVPVAHVEAGLRSFNKSMPEEINRILTDHVSSILFCPSSVAVSNLANEGINQNVYNVGDVMYDAAIVFGKIADNSSKILKDLNLEANSYLLTTIHRAENTDDKIRLDNLLSALKELSKHQKIIFPIHPRTRSKITSFISELPKGIKLIEPISFLDMVVLEKNSKCILTDSGGVQKEAFFHGVPCITLRDETEWVELVENGVNRLAGTTYESILAAYNDFNSEEINFNINLYGNGYAANRIVDTMRKL